jgi:hypothetical protein
MAERRRTVTLDAALIPIARERKKVLGDSEAHQEAVEHVGETGDGRE